MHFQPDLFALISGLYVSTIFRYKGSPHNTRSSGSWNFCAANIWGDFELLALYKVKGCC